MRLLVIGAGPAGLATALGLAERGGEVTVLEQASTAGGRVRTLHQDGYALELGPAGILDEEPAMKALLRGLGTRAPAPIHASELVRRRYVLHGGRPRALPTNPLQLLFGSTLSWAERWAILREPAAQPAADPAHETVAEFARRRFGGSIAEAFAQPAVVGIFGGDYEALELDSAFPSLRELERAHGGLLRGLMAQARARRRSGAPRPRLMSFRGGMGALPTAMAAALGERLQLGRGARAIEGRGRVRTSDGAVLEADQVVIATEPEVSARLLAPADAALSELIARIPAAAIASVSLAYRRQDVAHALDGFGLLCPRREGTTTIGVLFMSSIFPEAAQAPTGEVLLRVMMGGPNDPAICAGDDATILARAEAELARLLGVRGPARHAHLQRWPRAIAQYTVGHGDRRGAIEARARALGVHVTGTALHGVGVNDVVRDAARIVERVGG